MRVLCLNQDPGISPTRKKGAAVHLRAIRRALEECGAEVVPIDVAGEAEGRAVLERAAALGPVDLVYERYSLGSAAGAAFARAHGVPYVVEINAPLSEEGERWRGLSNGRSLLERERNVLSAADVVHAVSTQVAAYATEHGARPECVEVVPNGVDTARFRPRAAGDALRSTIADESRFVIGFHGRIRPWHGAERLVALARELLDHGAPVHLAVVGEGDLDVAALPADRVTRLRWVDHDEVGRYVAAFDVLPLTHPADQPFYFSPLKLAEAMACGVVPIVPLLGDLPNLVRDEHDALFVEPGDDDALMAAVLRLVEDAEFRRRLACNAVETASGFGWDRIARRVLEVAERAAGGLR